MVVNILLSSEDLINFGSQLIISQRSLLRTKSLNDVLVVYKNYIDPLHVKGVYFPKHFFSLVFLKQICLDFRFLFLWAHYCILVLVVHFYSVIIIDCRLVPYTTTGGRCYQVFVNVYVYLNEIALERLIIESVNV